MSGEQEVSLTEGTGIHIDSGIVKECEFGLTSILT
jgi:hypothetical protein